MPVLKGDNGTSGITFGGDYAVLGDSDKEFAIVGTLGSTTGAGYAVAGLSNLGVGVYGSTVSDTGTAIVANAIGAKAAALVASASPGSNSTGILSDGGDVGLHTTNHTTSQTEAYLSTKAKLAGDFLGAVSVTGVLTKSGGGFKIDHPLDPANKYLYHSFVESSDMKNIYDGVAVLNENGKAEVELPNWFQILNEDFRYQLTAVGSSAPNLHIEEEIINSRFKIAGGKRGMKVCWQVTGTRKDSWANANRLKVEEEKPANERDYYLHPELYDKSTERSMAYARYPESQKLRERVKKMIESESNRFKLK